MSAVEKIKYSKEAYHILVNNMYKNKCTIVDHATGLIREDYIQNIDDLEKKYNVIYEINNGEGEVKQYVLESFDDFNTSCNRTSSLRQEDKIMAFVFPGRKTP